MLKIGLVGNADSYHSKFFTQLFNGASAGKGMPGAKEDRVPDATITVLFDPQRAQAEKLASERNNPKVANCVEEVAAECDGVILIDDLVIAQHQHVPFFMKKGIPTLLDKPAAPSLDRAIEIFGIAKESGTPLMSCSSLRYSPQLTAFRETELPKLGAVHTVFGTAPNGSVLFYGIHAVEPIVTVLGTDIVELQNTGRPRHNIVQLRWADGKVATIAVGDKMRQIQNVFYGDKGWNAVTFTDQRYYLEMLKKFMETIRTKKAPIPYEETLTIIKICTWAEHAYYAGKPLAFEAVKF